MRTFAMLLLSTSAFGLRMQIGGGPRQSPAVHRRAGLIVAADVRECLADAENPAEIEDCLLPDAPHSTTSTPPVSGVLSPEEAAANRKDHLLGSAESLAECLWDSENPNEIAECRLDFEELIGVPTGTCSDEGICNPDDIRPSEAAVTAGGRSGSAPSMMAEPCSRKAIPGKCIFRGDKCTGNRCKVNKAPCKVNHASV